MADRNLPPGDQTEKGPAEFLFGSWSSRPARRAYAIALCLIYLVGVFPRLRTADFGEPDLTYADERAYTLGNVERFLSGRADKFRLYEKPAGIPNFLVLTFKPYYWLVKDHFGWRTIEEVQWWRVRHYWRSLNLLLGSLMIILAGLIGARAFNWRVGLLAAALCATSRACAVWFTFMKEEALMTLACAIALYAACRLFERPSGRRRWVVLGGLATGSAMAFKYNAAPVVPCFLLALFFSGAPATQKHRVLSWLSRFRLKEVGLYAVASALAFVAWFPQLVTRPHDVWRGVSGVDQFTCLDLARLKMPSLHELLSVAWQTWQYCYYFHPGGNTLTDTYPLYFFILMTGLVVFVPIYAMVRQHRFLLTLSLFVWLMYLMVYYQWLFSGQRLNHYFLPMAVPLFLLVAWGLEAMCGKIASWVPRAAANRSAVIQSFLLLAISAWPLWFSYRASREQLAIIRSTVGSVEEARAQRSAILSNLPAGARVAVPLLWAQPYVSDSFLNNVPFLEWHRNEWEKFTLDDLVQQGFDFVCAENYPLKAGVTKPVYLNDLWARHVGPYSILPKVSHFHCAIRYIPVQPVSGKSYNLGLYFREPRAGDYAAVTGFIPALPSQRDAKTTQNLILKARLSNSVKWWSDIFHWEILLNGRTLWRRSDTTETKPVSLSLPIQARPGDEILIRTIRTNDRQENAWDWGGQPSQLKVDGLTVVDADSGKEIPIKWAYMGVNGGPFVRYAMRTDWLHDRVRGPLLDPGFEGRYPLVDAWRPLQLIEPHRGREAPEETLCRQHATIEKAVGRGMEGSNALRFKVESPPRESARLGIMQPMAYPAARQVRKIWLHYRADGEAGNRGPSTLWLGARGLSLSGEFIDDAEVAVPIAPPSNEWNSILLEVADTWERRHTRTDLIDFLEVSIETVSGPDAVLNCLVDDVQVE